MERPKPFVIAVLCATVLSLAGLAAGAVIAFRRVRPPLDSFSVSPQDQALPILWNAPDFVATDQEGRAFSSGSLGGRPWVANFIFTRCTTACPLITAKLTLLRRSVGRADIRFVSFSVDPDFDSAAVLKTYASQWKGEDDPRWLLLQVDPASLPKIAAQMKVTVQRTDDQDDPIMHTSHFFLVDGQGRVRGVYDSTDDQALRTLSVDAASLEAASPPTVVREAQGARAPGNASAEGGRRLFHALGCAACHDNPRIAPQLEGLSGHRVKLEGARMATVDAAYLRDSILEPAKDIAAGYGQPMPSYRDHLSDEQVGQLVAYLQSLPGPMDDQHLAVAAQVAAGKAVDPVCGMEVVAGEQALHVEHGGKTFYFCSEVCRDKFVKDPRRWSK